MKKKFVVTLSIEVEGASGPTKKALKAFVEDCLDDASDWDADGKFFTISRVRVRTVDLD